MDNNLDTLIEGCRRQDRSSQTSLFKLFLPYVTSICKRYLRDESLLQDVVQETFLSIFKNISSSFDEKKGALKPWIRRISINSSLKINERYQGFEELEQNDYEKLATSTTSFSSDATSQEILQLIKAIPAPYRAVFNLHAIDGYSHQEIAKLLGISIENSRKKLQRARTHLRAQIERSQKVNLTKSA